MYKLLALDLDGTLLRHDQRVDERDAAAIAELAGHVAGLELEVHLVIPAGSSPAQIDELVSRYSALGPCRLLFTKLDECDRAPELAMAPPRTGLPITWVTTGQAVPEDIEQPTAARVLELASGGLASRKAACA
jgi:flagellar biosynthesis protein FlhF